MRIATAALVGAAAIATSAGVSRHAASTDVATGRFDLDVRKSPVLKLGPSHIDAVSAFVTYTDEFFLGRSKALKIQMYTAPMDGATRNRLLVNDKDDRELARKGSEASLRTVWPKKARKNYFGSKRLEACTSRGDGVDVPGIGAPFPDGDGSCRLPTMPRTLSPDKPRCPK